MDVLHVDMEGGTGPYMLLVHGFMASRAQWLANLEGLRAFCRPVVVELWGHGRSPTPTEPSAYAVEGYVEQFEAIREALGVERWWVCGQSFGAGLTIRYGLTHPLALHGQIITNSVSALGPPDSRSDAERAASAAATLAAGPEGLRHLPWHPRFGRRIPPPVAEGMAADAGRLSVTAIANATLHTTPGLAAGAALSALTVPTLLVNGRFERAFQPIRQALPDRLPGIRIVDLDGGHAINAEAPEAFNRAVEAFVRGKDCHAPRRHQLEAG